MIRRILLASSLLCLLAPRAVPQHVWVVSSSGGPGVDFFNVQGAVNAAADGDTILVRSGELPSFVIDGKSLTVAADAGATVHVDGMRVRHLAAGQSATLVGLAAGSSLSFLPGVEVLKISDCAGPVLLQDCTLTGGTLFALSPLLPTASVVNAAAVSFERCTLFGRTNTPPLDGTQGLTAEALSCSGSQVQLAHSTVTGAAGHPSSSQGFPLPATPGTRAVALVGTRLILLGSSVIGGAGADGTYSPFSESCTPGTDGGAGAALLDPASEVVVRASVLAGGPGGLGGSNPLSGGHCSDGLPGAASSGPGPVTPIAGDSNPLDLAPAVVREGGTGTLTLHGSAGSGALLLIGFGSSQLWLPGHQGVLLPTPSLLLVPLGTLPGSGTLSIPYAAPDLPAGVEGVVAVLQSAFTGGGAATLGGGGALVILDATL